MQYSTSCFKQFLAHQQNDFSTQYLHTIFEKLLKDDLTTDNEEGLLLELLKAHNQKEENIRIGEVLVSFGAINREDMESELKQFHELA